MFQSDEHEFAASVCDFWQVNRIPRSPLHPRTDFARWLGTDSEKNYHQRGNHTFTVSSVGYAFNSLGYRGPEFGPTAGGSAIMFVGDSNTFGIGMPYERLWTSLVIRSLEASWTRPVRQYNLGFGGTGSDYAAMIVHQSVDVLKPDAVCILWPSMIRMTWFPQAHRQVQFLPGWQPPENIEEHAAYLRLATPAQSFFNFVRNFQLVRTRLAQLSIPFFWGNLDPFSPDVLEPYTTLDGYVGVWKPLDLARDGSHAGLESHAFFAALVLDAMERTGFVGGAEVQPLPKSPILAPTHAISRAGLRKRLDVLPRPVRRIITQGRFRRRVRAMKRRDPFIY